MENLRLLTTLRRVASETLLQCQRQEYKPEVIYTLHNDKVNNIVGIIKNSDKLNGKSKAKFIAEINKIKLAPMRLKSYDSIQAEVKGGVSQLTSAIDFMKR